MQRMAAGAGDQNLQSLRMHTHQQCTFKHLRTIRTCATPSAAFLQKPVLYSFTAQHVHVLWARIQHSPTIEMGWPRVFTAGDHQLVPQLTLHGDTLCRCVTTDFDKYTS